MFLDKFLLFFFSFILCFFSLTSCSLPPSFLLSTITVRAGPIPSFLLPPISSFFFFFFFRCCVWVLILQNWRMAEWVLSFDWRLGLQAFFFFCNWICFMLFVGAILAGILLAGLGCWACTVLCLILFLIFNF